MRMARQSGGKSGGRRVEPELLDELPADDRRACRSRRDLRRVNFWMGHARIWVRQLSVLPGLPKSVLEIGAGDGTLLLRIARRLPADWSGVRVQLLDQQDVVTPKTLADLARLGWQAQVIKADVFEGLEGVGQVQLVIANLFLHHFDDARLNELFGKIHASAQVFAACEPRRFTRPRLAGGLVWLLGGNSVTRHDAVASVRAGFRGRELSALWPEPGGWDLEEGAAGLFSHFFLARRR
jgi:SAM-dependent methyltransferase